jgi:hypothetical protein
MQASQAVVRARWVEAEAIRLKQMGLSFDAIAEQITRVGLGQATPMVAVPEGVMFPACYRITKQACHKAFRKALAREPALEVDELRKIDQARSEEMFLNLQPAIRKGTSSLPTSSPSRKRSRWRLWVLVKTKEPKIEWHVSERNPDDLVDYLKKAGYVAQEIKAGRFFKRPGLWCTWCALIVAIGLIPSGIGITPGAQAQPRRIAHG